MTLEYIQKELGSEEKLIWSGRPKQGVVVQGLDYISIAIGVLFLAIAISVMATLCSSLFERPEVSVFPAIAALTCFMLLTAFFLFWRFHSDKIYRSHSYYGVTNKRVIIVSKRFSKTVYSLSLSELENVATIKEYSDKSGSITFASREKIRSAHFTPMPIIFFFIAGGDGIPRFKHIENVRKVFELIVPRK